jgi:hypothetical protein
MPELTRRAAEAAPQTEDKLLPVYIPWKTFENYVASLKGTTIPHQLDGTIKPRAMAGGLWRQLVSAFKFLGLAELSGVVVEKRLRQLVESHKTDRWKAAIKETVLPAYGKIIGDLPIETATPGQLNKRFKDMSGADGQMLGKCVRFYLYTLRESGSKYSDHLQIRERRAGSSQGPRKRKATAKNSKPGTGAKSHDGAKERTPRGDDTDPQDTTSFPVFLGPGRQGRIVFPTDVSTDDYEKFVAAIAYLKALAK